LLILNRVGRPWVVARPRRRSARHTGSGYIYAHWPKYRESAGNYLSSFLEERAHFFMSIPFAWICFLSIPIIQSVCPLKCGHLWVLGTSLFLSFWPLQDYVEVPCFQLLGGSHQLFSPAGLHSGECPAHAHELSKAIRKLSVKCSHE
jgi:hypothetical protein